MVPLTAIIILNINNKQTFAESHILAAIPEQRPK